MDERSHRPHLWRPNTRHVLISAPKLPHESGGSNRGPRPGQVAAAGLNGALPAASLAGQLIRTALCPLSSGSCTILA